MITIEKFQKLNEARGLRWHGGNLLQWSLLEWAGAMCGEAGEAANIAKKLRRLDKALPNKEAGLDNRDREKLELKLAQECADTIIYALLIFSALNIDAESVIADTFNQKSYEYGFPETL